MSSICNVNNSYNLTKTDSLPKSCSEEQTKEILLKALDNSDADQRFAAVQRLSDLDNIAPRIKEKTLKMFAQEKDHDVLSELANFFAANQIEEAVPQLLKKLNIPAVMDASLYALEKLADASSIPALQKAFKDTPSYPIAVLLLKLGDPYPYYHNFAKADLELFNERSTRMAYTDPLCPLGFGYGSSTCKTEIVPTVASRMKPKAINNLQQMLDAFAKKKDGKIIPFLFSMLKSPKNPIPREKIISTFKSSVSKEDFPVLFAGLKSSKHPITALFILEYLGEKLILYKHLNDPKFYDLYFKEEKNMDWGQKIQSLIKATESYRSKRFQDLSYAEKEKIKQLNKLLIKETNPQLSPKRQEEELDAELREATIQTIMVLLENKELRRKAVKILAEIGEKRIIPKLIEIIHKDPYCSIEVKALAKLQTFSGGYPANFEAVYEKVLKHKEYSKGAKVNAALALALFAKKRDGILLLFDGLYDLATGFAADSSPQKLMLLGEAISKVIKRTDIEQVKRFFKPFHPGLARIGLGLLKQIGGPNDVSLVLPILEDKNLEYDVIGTELKFNALLTLITIRDPADQKSLDAVKRGMKYWNSYDKGDDAYKDYRLAPIVRDFLPKLKNHVERSELAVKNRRRKSLINENLPN
ncbi:MAG: hypothetical protein ABIA67_03105 [Candidatus Margulisiibacteriota bacterium]